MLDATIEAVIIPAFSTPDRHVPYRNGKIPFGRQLQARVLVPSQWILDSTFEGIQYCFVGVLQTRIGSKANRETLICLTGTRSLEDFQPCTPGSSDPFPRHYLDFTLHISTSETVSCIPGAAEDDDLPPSTSFSGSMYVAQQTVLSDQHRVQGTCEVSYRIQARFCRGQKLVRELSMPITLLADQQLVLKAPPLSDIVGWPKFNMRNIWKSPPTLSLDLFDLKAMHIRHDLMTQHKSISTPLTMKLRYVGLVVDDFQSLRCTVEASWCRRRSFATTKLNNKNSPSQRIDRVFRSAHQTRVVNLPPLWPTEAPDDADQTHTYAATTDIVLFVPDWVASPTIQCGLFSKTYTLELSFCFEGGQSIPRYTISRSIPVKVQVHNLGAEALAKSLTSGLMTLTPSSPTPRRLHPMLNQARGRAILAAS